MANIMTPSLMPGERSLPAELRTLRGSNFAQRRLNAGLQPSAMPSASWNGKSWRPRMSGLGQDDTSIDTTYVEPTPITPDPLGSGSFNSIPTTNTLSFPWVTDPVGTSQVATAGAQYAAPSSVLGGQPTVLSPTAPTPAAPSGYQWASLLNQSGATIAKILTISQGGSSVTLPNGTQLLYGSGTGTGAASALSSLSAMTGVGSNTLLLVGLAVGAFLLLNRK
jgi:hypothetical protein